MGRLVWKRLLALMLVAGLAVAFSACGGSDDSDGADASGDEAGETTVSGGGNSSNAVKFGLLTGLTGDYSAFSDAVVGGSEIAIEEINAAGGVLGKDVVLVIQDNKSTPEGAVAGFEKLVNVDKVVAIGGVESDGGVAVLERAPEKKVPVICSFCGTTVLDERGGNFMYRITASDNDGAAAAAQFARDRGLTKVSLLRQEGEAGMPAQIFSKVWQENLGNEIVSDVQIDPGKSSYQVELQQAFSGDPEAVFASIGHEAANSIFPEWERRGYGGEFLVSPDLLTPETTFPYLEDGVATGAIAAFDRDTPAFEHFSEALQEKQGHPPSEGLGEPLNYDTFILLALAVEAAGSTDGDAINEAIREVTSPPGEKCFLFEECMALLKDGKQIDYHGASNSLDLNETGNLHSPPIAEMQLEDGEWVPVETISLDPSLKPNAGG